MNFRSEEHRRIVKKTWVCTGLLAIVMSVGILMGTGASVQADSAGAGTGSIGSTSVNSGNQVNTNSGSQVRGTAPDGNYFYYTHLDWYLKPVLTSWPNLLHPFDDTVVSHSILTYVEIDNVTGDETVAAIAPYPDFPTIAGYHVDGQNNSYTWDSFVLPSGTDIQSYVKDHPLPVYYLADQGIGPIIPIIATVVGIGAIVHQATANSSTGPTPTPAPDNQSSSASSATESSTSSASTSDTSSDSNQTVTEPSLAAKGEVVSGISRLSMYKKPTGDQADQLAVYARKPQINRPMFVVTGYSGSNFYQVRDVNHGSNTYGQQGYITTNAKFVIPAYYGSLHPRVTVINPRGVNSYTNQNLTNKVKHYRQGTILKVSKIVDHNLTTRFYIGNGQYITANKKLVYAGQSRQPKLAKVVRSIYKYRDVNLTQRKKPVKKGTTLKVKRWDYSAANKTNQTGSKRYLIAGGYITANSRFVKVIK